MTEKSGMVLPDYERFYLGGMNSVRGFEWRDLHALDENGDEIGGDKFVFFNYEILIPISKKLGLGGVLFFDTGNVFGKDESVDLGRLRESADKVSVVFTRGPIRVECGYILDPQKAKNPVAAGNSAWGRRFFSL